MANIFCPSCGSDCPADSNFCLKCGKPLSRDYSSLPPKKESDFITLACPNCGGSLKITQDMERFACQYCGYEHLVRRNGNVVSLQPVMEGLKRVENKFDHVLSGSDRLAAEQTIQRLKGEIVDIQKRISASESLIQKQGGRVFTSIGVIIMGFVMAVISAIIFFSWGATSDADFSGLLMLIGFFILTLFIILVGFLSLAANAKGISDIQKNKSELPQLKAGLENRRQQLYKLDRYTTQR